MNIMGFLNTIYSLFHIQSHSTLKIHLGAKLNISRSSFVKEYKIQSIDFNDTNDNPKSTSK